jgi:cytochrome c oxidase subunit 2
MMAVHRAQPGSAAAGRRAAHPVARRLRLPALALPCAIASVAHAQIQSALDPHSVGAHAVAALTWTLTIGATSILLLVMGLTAYALLAPHRRRRWLAGAPAIVIGGIAFPVVTLSALLVYELLVADDLLAAGADPVRIEVTGEQWWWRVRYLDRAGIAQFETANEIHVPVDQPVELILVSRDVIHSFWVPKLGGKVDMIPGRANRMRLTADRPGTFRGQCAEYCGGPHAMMAFYVVAKPAADFEAWVRRQREPARAPSDPWQQSGQALFMSSGCLACHTIRGTGAMSSNGPDLTHVGSRLSIAAGNFPTHQGTLAGWIADSQGLKPGNHMPSFPVFLGAELRALAGYLESLE